MVPIQRIWQKTTRIERLKNGELKSMKDKLRQQHIFYISSTYFFDYNLQVINGLFKLCFPVSNTLSRKYNTNGLEKEKVKTNKRKLLTQKRLIKYKSAIYANKKIKYGTSIT